MPGVKGCLVESCCDIPIVSQSVVRAWLIVLGKYMSLLTTYTVLNALKNAAHGMIRMSHIVLKGKRTSKMQKFGESAGRPRCTVVDIS